MNDGHFTATLNFVRHATTVDLLEEIEDYEVNKFEYDYDEEDEAYYQACRDAIVVRTFTGR